jgi:acyl-CoA synthetase (AMP-forming)/AMP-acid ligase II
MVFRSPWPEIALPDVSIAEAILPAAEARGDKPAVIESETGATLTYRALAEGARRVAAGIAKAGIRPGDPVAVALPNCLDFVLAWYGALRAGAWVVPMNPLYTPSEMEHQLRDSGARHLVTVPERTGVLASAVETIWTTGSTWDALLDNHDAAPAIATAPTDLAALPYSSGTTGKPKGVMLTHRNILANIRQIHQFGDCQENDLIVNMMPLYHAAGLNYMLNPLMASGGTLVLMRRFDLETWLGLMEQYRATAIGGPPPVMLAVTKSPLWERFRLDSLRYALCGAAPLGADLQQAFEERTGLLLRQLWGMTEGTSAVAAAPVDRSRRKFGSCGFMLGSSEARVVDIASGRDLGAGETGELWIRGPNVTQGYWRQPEANADTQGGDGWLRTGDIGYFDEDGCVFLVDRLKELIKYNALQVAPAELEDIVQTHPAVRDAAVVGAPDEKAGEIPMAFVVRKAGASLEAAELMEYVAARVAPHKKIRAVEFVEEIPKSPTGKTLRRMLKERARGAHS